MNERKFQNYRRRLLERLEKYREMTDTEIYDLIDQILLEDWSECYVRLSERSELKNELFNSVRRLDILQELVDDDSVTEIMVNGTEGIFIERGGGLIRWEKSFSSREKLEDIVQQIVAKCNRVANEAVSIVDARLENGARVNIVMAPVAVNGPVITIRRFPDHPISMEQLIEWNAVSAEAADFLKKLVHAGYNIFISGENVIIGLSQLTFRKRKAA